MSEIERIDDFQAGGDAEEETAGRALDTSLAVNLSRAEIDAQIATARQWPRSLTRATRAIMTLATMDPIAAEECMYALPRAGKPIIGPSIRFAEILFASYGNCRAAARVVAIDHENGFVEAEGVFHDLESNAAQMARVRRRITDKRGRIFNDDMIIVTGNAACAIAKRNAILSGVPRTLWRGAIDKVQEIMRGDGETLAERRVKAIKAFAMFGVKPELVLAALRCHGEEDVTLDHIVVLRGMFSALKNGEETVETMFSGLRPAGGAHEIVKDPLADTVAESGAEPDATIAATSDDSDPELDLANVPDEL